MYFDKLGFCNENIDLLIKTSNDTYSKEYNKLYALSKLGKYFIDQTLNLEINKGKLTGEQLIILSLLIKMMNRSESIICLIERGLEADAKVLLRGFIEQLIMLKLCCEDKDNIETYAKNGLLMQKHSVNDLIENKIYKDKNQAQNLHELKHKLNLLSSELNIKKEEKFHILARKAGMYSLYARVYRMFSGEVHSSLNTLEGYILIDRDTNKIVGANTRPQKDIQKILKLLIKQLGITLDIYQQFMNLSNNEIPKEIEKLFVHFNQ